MMLSLSAGETVKAFVIADEYQIDLLREACENFLVQSLNCDLGKLDRERKYMSDLQKNAVLKKGFFLLSFTKTCSSDKIAFFCLSVDLCFSNKDNRPTS